MSEETLQSAPQTYPWESLPDEQLLELRFCELKLQLSPELQKAVAQLHAELAHHGLLFKPGCYLGDEWFCPDGFPIISVPFYLAHPRLKQLERKMMLETEGSGFEQCMCLLRHEAGHAINYAYFLHRKKKWRELFGPFSAPYEGTYKPRPYSKQYVRHLEDWYAQYHPDEDFAETFAVWLAPNSNWRELYQGWGALKKLEYVDELIKSLKDKMPVNQRVKRICDVSLMRSKLKTHYERKRHALAHDLPDFYDQDLRRIFCEAEGELPAQKFLSKQKNFIISSVARWTGEPKFMINRFMSNLKQRCTELNLKACREEKQLAIEVASYLTMLTMNYRSTGRFTRVP